MDRVDFYFQQIVTEAELDQAFDFVEAALQNLIVDLEAFGVFSGLVVTTPETGVNVDVTDGVAYANDGTRILRAGAGLNVDLSLDQNGLDTEPSGGGNERWVSLFIRRDIIESEPRIDGNSNVLNYLLTESYELVVRMGIEASAGTAQRPDLVDGEILLVDVLRAAGDTVINTGELDFTRRQDLSFLSADRVPVDASGWTTLDTASERVQDVLDDLDTLLTNHFAGTADQHDAAAITYDDTNDYEINGVTDVETAIKRLDRSIGEFLFTRKRDGTFQPPLYHNIEELSSGSPFFVQRSPIPARGNLTTAQAATAASNVQQVVTDGVRIYYSQANGDLVAARYDSPGTAIWTVGVDFAATGTIDTIAGNLLGDGEEFVLDDGTNPAVTFEFDDDSSVTETATLRQIIFDSGTTADQIRDRIIDAVNNAPALNITASDGGTAQVDLINDNGGTAGNVAITETVSNAGFTVSGMSGGLNKAVAPGLAADGLYVYALTQAGVVNVYNASDGAQVASTQATPPPGVVQVDGNGVKFALYNAATGRNLIISDPLLASPLVVSGAWGASGDMRSICISKDLVIACGTDNGGGFHVQAFDLTGTVVWQYGYTSAGAIPVDICTDGEYVYVCSEAIDTQNVKCLSLGDGSLVWESFPGNDNGRALAVDHEVLCINVLNGANVDQYYLDKRNGEILGVSDLNGGNQLRSLCADGLRFIDADDDDIQTHDRNTGSTMFLRTGVEDTRRPFFNLAVPLSRV